LRNFARSLTGSTDLADDLVQTGIEKALRNLDSFVPGTRLDAWMFRILRNAWIDTVRARRDTVQFDADMNDTLIGEDGRLTAENRLHLSEVRRAMAELPEEQRSVLMLVCVEGMRYREVAEVLEIPEGTVMSRLSRARLALAHRLQEKPVHVHKQGTTQ
jgi:RNA polymerase sigma-70 factor (ECF subfamily)